MSGASGRVGGVAGRELAHADVAVVVVHGIGQQVRGATLLEWAEPLAQRMNYHAVKGGLDGVEVIHSTLLERDASQQESRVRVTIPAGRAETRTIDFLEARWADAFLAFDVRSFVSWARAFSWRAAQRIANHILRYSITTFRWTPAVLPGALPRREPEAARPERARGARPGFSTSYFGTALVGAIWLLRVVNMFVGVVVAAIGFVVYGLLIAPFSILAIIGVALLGFVSRLPLVGKRVQPLMLAMVSTLGDAAAWTKAPLRASAMRDTVRAQVCRAAEIADRVVVIAHSQGAAVTARALFSADFLDDYPETASRLRAVVTLGGANTLLRQPAWRVSGAGESDVVDSWAEHVPDHVRWINIWSSLDPVPAGPVAHTESAVRRRWLELKHAPRLALSALKERQPDRLVYFGDLTDTWVGLNLVPPHAALDQTPPGASLGTLMRQTILTSLGFGRRGDADDTWEERRRAFNRDLMEVRALVGRGPGEIGPEERMVENRLSVVTDHTTYTSNTIEVIDPLAELITGVANDRPYATPPPLTPVQLAHRRGLATLIFAKVALAVVSVLVAPVLVRGIDQWLTAERVKEFPLKAFAQPASEAIALTKAADLWILLLYAFTIIVLYLVLSSVAKALWQAYDDGLAWRGFGAKGMQRFASFAFFGFAFLSIYAAFLLSMLRLMLDDPYLSTIVLLGSLYLTLVVLLLPRMRISLLPLPERRRGTGDAAAAPSRTS